MTDITELLTLTSASAQRQAAVKEHGLTLCILLLDGSGSMYEFGQTPLRAANEFLANLKASEAAATIAVQVLVFSESAETAVELDFVNRVPLMSGYSASGSTRLYGVIKETLADLFELVASATTVTDSQLRVSLAVITDGIDDPPTRTQDTSGLREELRTLAGRARSLGWNLQIFGIGVPAQDIASDVNFPPDRDHAHTLAHRRDSLQRSLGAFCRSTIMTAVGPMKAGTPPSTP